MNGTVKRKALVWALIVVAALWVMVLLVEGVLAAVALDRADSERGVLTRAVAQRDLNRADVAAHRLGEQTARARTLLSGPQWAVPQTVPGVGDDLRALRLSLFALDDVVQGAAVPILDASTTIRRPDGGLNVAALSTVLPVLDRAGRVTERADRQLSAIRPAGLWSPLRPPVTQLRDAMRQVASTTATARDAARLADALLGTSAPTTTLFAVQNPAEVRGSGGIIGAYATLRGVHGELSMTSTGVNDALFPYRASAAAVPAEVVNTYGKDILHVANVTMTPDFPVAARLFLSSYRAWQKATPRAQALPAATNVVTLTPRGLGTLIGATAPIAVPSANITVTSQNAQALFENEIYTLVPNDAQRVQVVQVVLSSIFTSLRTPTTDPIRLAQALAAAADSGDLRLWSPDAAVQAASVRIGSAGDLGRPDGKAVRVTLASADSSKLDFYLRERIVLDRLARSLTVTLANTAPPKVATYVAVNNPARGQPLTGHDVILQVHLPPGVGVERIDVQGTRVGFGSGTESGWRVLRLGTRVVRSSSVTITLRLTGGVGDLATVIGQPLSTPANVTVK